MNPPAITIVQLSVVQLSEWRQRMSKPDKTLDSRIPDAAKREFLEKGYERASTNAICKTAGVTWGAL